MDLINVIFFLSLIAVLVGILKLSDHLEKKADEKAKKKEQRN